MHPSHFISSAQINLRSELNEYTRMRNLAGQDIITKGNSVNKGFCDGLFSSHHAASNI